ncbi:MAG: CobD/CbiB family cobalamin biosynthesis protein [Kangiellaceae bacterium]
MLSFWLNSSFSSSGVELPFYYFIFHLGIVSTGAVILDLMFSEVSRFHPLAAFGRAAASLERVANPYHQSNLSCDDNNPYKAKLFGLLGALGLILPISFVVMISALFVSKIWLAGVMLDSVILYFCIGLTSMRKHVLAIARPLENQQIALARKACSQIVSRDVDNLTQEQICKAAVESTLENTNDAVIASLFWYAIGGIPMAVAHRLINTLDAMWGYKNKRFQNFGWAAAKLDDVLAWPTAKVTGWLFALQGVSRRVCCIAIQNAQSQSLQYKSRNGGFVMSAGASVMAIQLGGEASYHGETKLPGHLGDTTAKNKPVEIQHIKESVRLMNRAVLIWLAIISILSISLFLFLSF